MATPKKSRCVVCDRYPAKNRIFVICDPCGKSFDNYQGDNIVEWAARRAWYFAIRRQQARS